MKDEILRKVKWCADGIDIFTDKKRYKWWPAGDCCSQSFIIHVDVPLLGGTILSSDIEGVPIDPWEWKNYKPTEEVDDEEIKQYFYKIITTKGELMIEMRNYSNGYYGGTLERGATVKLTEGDDQE